MNESLLASLVVALSVLMGYCLGHGGRKVLRRQIDDLRKDLETRERLMAERAVREDKIIRASLAKTGTHLEGDGDKPKTIDRSRKAVAKLLRENRATENDRQWEETYRPLMEEQAVGGS